MARDTSLGVKLSATQIWLAPELRAALSLVQGSEPGFTMSEIVRIAIRSYLTTNYPWALERATVPPKVLTESRAKRRQEVVAKRKLTKGKKAA